VIEDRVERLARGGVVQRRQPGQDQRPGVGRDAGELGLVGGERPERRDRLAVARWAELGERDRGLERDREILAARVPGEPLDGAAVAEPRERRGVPDLERRRCRGLELAEQRARRGRADLAERLAGVTADLPVGIALGQLGQRRRGRLILELAERVCALRAHGGLGLAQRRAQHGLRAGADRRVIEHLGPRRRWRPGRSGRGCRRRHRYQRRRRRRLGVRPPDRQARDPDHRGGERASERERAAAATARCGGGGRQRRRCARRLGPAQDPGVGRPGVAAHVVQIGEHVGRAGVARGRVLHQHPVDDLGDRRGHAEVRGDVGEPRRLAEQVAGHDRLQRVADERGPAGEHLVGDHAHRVEVGAVVDVPRAVDLLGRHVVRRPDHRSGLGQPLAGALGPDQLGDPEVEQLDLDSAVVPGLAQPQPDVVGLEIAVDEALVVRRLERAQRLVEDRKRLGPGQRAAADPRRQRLALEVLHHEEHAAVRIAAEVVDVDDVLVPDRVDRARLLVEPLDDLLGPAQLRLQDLDRRGPADLGVLGGVDHAHAALGELAPDRVAAQLPTDEAVRVPGTGAGDRGGSRNAG
jgi:hypothetical protein